MEVGRDHEKLIILARPYTPYVVPAVLVAADGTQDTTNVAQGGLSVAIVRSRGPPGAAASIVERAIVVVPAIYRGESGGVASNTLLFVIGW